MNLSTIVIPEDEARERLAEYEAAVREERNVQDEAIAMGYRAAARGLPIIRLSESIAAGGYFDHGLPKIAVVRADATQCAAHWDGDSLVFADGDRWTHWSQNQGALVNEVSVRVRPGNKPERVSYGTRTTIVPLVPPRFRPRRPRRLSRCHILWEVEKWDRTPPRDPALLRYIRGDLWAVLAVWDLSELERAVLAM